MSLKIREIRDTAALLELEQTWDGLLRASAVDGVFLTWEHARTWWEFYGEGKMSLRVLIAEDGDGRTVGIAPLVIGPGEPGVRSNFRHLAILGGLGDSLSEYLDLIIERGREAEIGRAFGVHVMEAWRADWDVAKFGMVRDDSVAMPAFLAAVGEVAGEADVLAETVAPALELPESWDSFLAGRSQNFRRGIRVARKRLAEGRSVVRRRIEDPEDIREAMEVLADLNRERWGEEGEAFQSGEFEAFHRCLAERFLKRGWLYLAVLEVDGEAVGARYDFIYGGKLWCFQGGWNPALAKVGLGKVMVADVVEWAIGEGLSEYDFLAGDARYKREWSTTERRLLNYEGVNEASLRGMAFRVLRKVKSAVRGRGKGNGKAAAA